MEGNKGEKRHGPEHTLASLLEGEGFSVAVVAPDVTLEELEEIFPQSGKKEM